MSEETKPKYKTEYDLMTAKYFEELRKKGVFNPTNIEKAKKVLMEKYGTIEVLAPVALYEMISASRATPTGENDEGN